MNHWIAVRNRKRTVLKLALEKIVEDRLYDPPQRVVQMISEILDNVGLDYTTYYHLNERGNVEYLIGIKEYKNWRLYYLIEVARAPVPIIYSSQFIRQI